MKTSEALAVFFEETFFPALSGFEEVGFDVPVGVVFEVGFPFLGVSLSSAENSQSQKGTC